MAGAFVQGVTEYTGGDTAPVLTGVGAGNALIVVNYAAVTTDPTSVTSSVDGAFTKLISGNSGGSGQTSVYWKNGVTSGTHTVTVNNGGSGIHTVLLEVSGLSAYVSASTLKDGFSASPASNSLTPTSGDYILGFIANNNADHINAMTTLTERADLAAARGLAVGDYTAPSTSAVTIGGSLSGGSGFWVARVLNFTPSGGGGGGQPIFPPMSRVPGRSLGAPPDVSFWVEPAAIVVAPFLGQATQVPRGKAPFPPNTAKAAPIVLQGELPLPPTRAPVIPRRAPSLPLETYQWPGLPALDPHIEDFPVAPWTAAMGVPKTGTWRPVGVIEGQIPPTVAVEPPPGQAQLGRGAPRAPEGGTWATFWNPPDVVAPLPPGVAGGGVPPPRLPVRGLVELSGRLAQALLVEFPPGRSVQAGGRTLARGPAAWGTASTLLFAIVLPPPPAQAGTGGPPRTAALRGRTTIWSWSGYIPAPTTPLPPGVQKGPFAGKGHGHAPVSPYLAAYVISLPPALFGPAELWQFPDGTTLYTFGGSEAVAWEFQADRIIWEW